MSDHRYQDDPAGGTERVDGEYHYSYRYANKNQNTGSHTAGPGRSPEDPVERIQHTVEQTAERVQRTAQQAAEHIKRTVQERDAARNQDTARTPQVHIQKAAPAHRAKLPSGKPMTVFGAIIAAIFGTPFTYYLTRYTALAAVGNFWNNFIPYVLAFGAFTVLGLGMLGAGVLRNRRKRMASMYLGLIGNRQSVPLSALCGATGQSYRKVCKDLQDLLDRGGLPQGYLDLAGDRLVLSAEGIVDEEPQRKEAPAAEAPPQEEDDILREIREVNDQIADPTMSAKIDRIGEITGKILDYQRQHPGKAGQLRSFLNYYLPTTLKILRAYAQLEQQGIEGENISAAKARIEGMMDKVVEGFEKQLDKLFQSDALDISSDVAVLEKMLDNDGLSSSGGMTMGG